MEERQGKDKEWMGNVMISSISNTMRSRAGLEWAPLAWLPEYRTDFAHYFAAASFACVFCDFTALYLFSLLLFTSGESCSPPPYCVTPDSLTFFLTVKNIWLCLRFLWISLFLIFSYLILLRSVRLHLRFFVNFLRNSLCSLILYLSELSASVCDFCEWTA